MILECGDCLELIKKVPDKSIDLIVTDPPYLIKNTKAGGNSELARSIQKMNDNIEQDNIVSGFDTAIFDECLRVMKKLNAYFWCNKEQIPMYLDYFVNKNGCSFDILCWQKDNATPLFNNKYLSDKEYCLYFRRGGYCNPQSYDDAKTVWHRPINIDDKKEFEHPTIKPLSIIETLVRNSSTKGQTVLDPFMGSGTTGVACVDLQREFIGYEINPKYYEIAKRRIDDKKQQMETMFQWGFNLYQE